MLQPPSPLRFGIYCRISRDRVGAGLGVERQLTDCRDLVERMGGEVTLVLQDNDLSGMGHKHRPGYQQLLQAMRDGQIDAVAVWHSDRLTRSMVELEEFVSASEAHDIRTHTVRAGLVDLSTPSGRLVARQLGAVARYEVEHAIERQKSAKLQAAKSGRWSGGPRPFGFHADGVTIRPGERRTLLEMAERLIAGDSYRAIAMDLNARKITTSQGRGWTALRVENQLFRKRNFGLRTHLGHDYPAQWPAIFDEETAAKLYVARAARSAVRNSHGTGRKYLLKGFLFCGVCGNGLTIYSCQQRNGEYIPAVACRTRDEVPGKKGCGGVKRNLPPIDHLITEAVLYRLDSDAMRALLSHRPDGKAREYLAAQQAQQVRLDEILERYSKGELDYAEYRVAKATATSELERLGKLVDRASVGSPLAEMNGKSIRDVWPMKPLEWQRAVIHMLVEKIEVLPVTDRSHHAPLYAGQWKFDVGLVRVVWKV